MAVRLYNIDDFKLKRLIRLAVAFTANCPGMHLFRKMTQGGHLAHIVEVLLRRIICQQVRIRIQGHLPLHSHVPQRRIVRPQ